jgi:glycosyltransferase involved in cell wall biosynthesis
MQADVLGRAAPERFSILYAAPGPYLTSTGGTAICVLSCAKELARWANVTVAFRAFLEPPLDNSYGAIALQDGTLAGETGAAPRVSPDARKWGDIPYLRRLSQFAADSAGRYDVVLEHGWDACGYLLAAFRRHGVPGAAVVGTIRTMYSPLRSARDFSRVVTSALRGRLARRGLRSAPRIIAETEQLKGALMRRLGVPAERIAVVGLGVDHSLFRPLPQSSARAELGISERSLVLLYVGSFDKYHDLRPALEALAVVNRPDTELHLVGDDLVGEQRHRRRYEQLAAKRCISAFFHGRVARGRVPTYIAAADLCLAPYDLRAFVDGELTSFTLKVPEYMACGRPVATVPSGHLQELVTDGVNGFLVPNRTDHWAKLLRSLGSRERLRAMGQHAAAATEHLTWAKTAAGYWDVCQELLAGATSTSRLPASFGLEVR